MWCSVANAPRLNLLTLWLGAACFLATGYLAATDHLGYAVWSFVAGFVNLALADAPLYDEVSDADAE